MITFLAVWLCLISELLEQVQSLILDCPTTLERNYDTMLGDNQTIFIQRVILLYVALKRASSCSFSHSLVEKCIFNPGRAAVLSCALL